MKIGLLLPANVFFCPYATIFSNLLEKWGVDYDIICWDKTNRDEVADYVYHKRILGNSSTLKKLYYYYQYTCFIKKCIKDVRYDKLIVFGPQIGIFLYPFLNCYYKNQFVLDYRDLSIEQRFKRVYGKLLQISGLNTISSPAFRKCLPKGFKYVISHNINDSLTREALKKEMLVNEKSKITVLTIGAIRDLEQNIELMNSLAFNTKFQIQFVGKSDLSDFIKDYAEEHKICNASFVGFYKKEEESSYVDRCTFLNIYYPRKLSHDTAISNRFYNSLIYCKPMIVTKDTIQGDLVEKYGVGIAIANCEGLADKLIEYQRTFNLGTYMEGRNALLKLIIGEQDEFIDMFHSFVY